MEPHSGLNNLDFIVIGIILLSGLLALMRGFTREIFSLIAWSGAYFAAAKLHPLVTPTMHHYVKSDEGAKIAAMVAVFFVSLVLLLIVGSLVAGMIKGQTLTIIDRSLGFLYGVLRGALVVSLIYLGARMILWPDMDKPQLTEAADQTKDKDKDKDRNVPPDMLLESRTRGMMAFGANRLVAFIPQDMIDKSLKGIENHKEQAEKEAEKAAEQKTLDKLSTPVPPHSAEGPGSIDINRIQGSQP